MTLEPFILEQHLKGCLGEMFTITALNNFVLRRPKELKYSGGVFLENGTISQYEIIESIPDGYPDFNIKGTKDYIEIKTTKKDVNSSLKPWQRDKFKEMLSNGNRLFMIKPHIVFKRMKISVKMFDCYQLHIHNNKLRYEKICFDELKQRLNTPDIGKIKEK